MQAVRFFCGLFVFLVPSVRRTVFLQFFVLFIASVRCSVFLQMTMVWRGWKLIFCRFFPVMFRWMRVVRVSLLRRSHTHSKNEGKRCN